LVREIQGETNALMSGHDAVSTIVEHAPEDTLPF
jgi:hypothetical protein